MKISIAALVAALLLTSVASAQNGIPRGGGPGHVPYGAGVQRGLQGVNNSGQPGFITMFDRGHRTAVVVAVEDSGNRVERAAIVRGNDCTAIGSNVFVHLNDVMRGDSRGYVPYPMARLFSGNYLAVVYSGPGPNAHPVSCGELYH